MSKQLEGVGLYRGTKELKAWPMTRGEYVMYRRWELPAGEEAADAGYLVEYIDGGNANDSRHSGYISWSPADVFDKTYYRTDGADATLCDSAETPTNDWRATENRRMALGEAVKLVVSADEVYGPNETLAIAKALETYLNGEQPA